MFFLKKLFRAREAAADRRAKWNDVEKPFLDHLEDLRRMLMKSVVTVLIIMVAAFVFDKQLLSIIRGPAEKAGILVRDNEVLPPVISRGEWPRIKEIAWNAASLHGEERQAYLQVVTAGDEGLLEKVEAVLLYRIALSLPERSRPELIAILSEDRELIRTVALDLLARNPDATIDDRGDLMDMSALGPTETFTLSLKLAFFAGILISFPFLLYYLAEFILPGLTPKERRMLLPAVGVGFLLFLTGVFFAYYIVVPEALAFFINYSDRLGVSSDWRIGMYVSFVTKFTLLFGLCFELPVVVMSLVKLGILDFTTMKTTRSYAIVFISVLSAFVTPADPLTMILLAVPMVILYEICIWLAYFMEKKAAKEEDEDEREWEGRMLTPAIDADNGDGGDDDDDPSGGGGPSGDGGGGGDKPSGVPRAASGIVQTAVIEDEVRRAAEERDYGIDDPEDLDPHGYPIQKFPEEWEMDEMNMELGEFEPDLEDVAGGGETEGGREQAVGDGGDSEKGEVADPLARYEVSHEEGADVDREEVDGKVDGGGELEELGEGGAGEIEEPVKKVAKKAARKAAKKAVKKVTKKATKKAVKKRGGKASGEMGGEGGSDELAGGGELSEEKS